MKTTCVFCLLVAVLCCFDLNVAHSPRRSGSPKLDVAQPGGPTPSSPRKNVRPKSSRPKITSLSATTFPESTAPSPKNTRSGGSKVPSLDAEQMCLLLKGLKERTERLHQKFNNASNGSSDKLIIPSTMTHVWDHLQNTPIGVVDLWSLPFVDNLISRFTIYYSLLKQIENHTHTSFNLSHVTERIRDFKKPLKGFFKDHKTACCSLPQPNATVVLENDDTHLEVGGFTTNLLKKDLEKLFQGFICKKRPVPKTPRKPRPTQANANNVNSRKSGKTRPEVKTTPDMEKLMPEQTNEKKANVSTRAGTGVVSPNPRDKKRGNNSKESKRVKSTLMTTIKNARPKMVVTPTTKPAEVIQAKRRGGKMKDEQAGKNGNRGKKNRKQESKTQ